MFFVFSLNSINIDVEYDISLVIKIFKGFTRKKATQRKRIKLWKLKDDERRKEFEKQFASGMEGGDGCWRRLVRSILTAGKAVCGETKGGRGRQRETWWWSEAVQKVIKEKKEVYKRWQRSGNEEDREEYRNKKREAKHCVAEANRKAWQEWSKSLSTPDGRNKMFRVAAQMKKDGMDIQGTNFIKDEDGTIKVDGSEVKEVWRRYFEGLLNEENNTILEDVPPVEGPIEGFTLEEVRRAVKSLKSGKASGPSGVTGDMLKLAGDSAVKELHGIFQRIMSTEECPEQWINSLTVALYKGKGDPLQCSMYRGLRLLEHGMKAFEKILDKRLRKLVTIADTQFAYRPGKSCNDAIFITRRLQEKYLEKNKKLYQVFVDLQKCLSLCGRYDVNEYQKDSSTWSWRCMLVRSQRYA